ncbi:MULTISPECIES: BppU family phage baseplate upper protein [unclassified Bacillus cereus group]|uniref:BppU family phage baseplate upper protein n=1 Tax=unclassified Bacillus cereus group TaxID=2750818 RepID=UPI003390F6C9
MRTETLVLDLSNQSMPRTITARENDRNGFKVIVNLRERGKSVDLTGFAVFYEAISPLGMFVRDIAVITNFRDGVFEYTVSKEAVSSAGTWVGYFAFEKGTERFTTQDIRISLGSDVKSGSVQLENYIAEFDKLKKQIDALQIAVDKADVVKRSGGTMTGSLTIDNSDFLILKGGVNGRDWKLIRDSTNKSLVLVPQKNTLDGWDWAKQVEFRPDNFVVNGGTNLLKKTGDTMTGDLTIKKDGASLNFSTVGGSRNARIFYNANEASDSGLNIQTPNGKLLLRDGSNITREVATKENDTDWIPLTLLNGVKQQSSQPASAVKRSGNVVNIVCAITDFKDKQVIANVPAIFRPDREMLFTPNYFQGLALKTGYVIVKPNGDIYLEGIEATVSLYRFSLTYNV